MNKKKRLVSLGLVVVAIVALLAWYLHHVSIPILEPRGTTGDTERNLIVFTFLLGLVVIIPVFTMTIGIAWKYREGNKKAKYRPEWDRNRLAETAWWGIPIIIIGILSVVTWKSTYALNPFKPIESTKPTLTIQVVSLDWKWLFIYPGQNIATVNMAQVPVNTPVDFEITSDTVMNSFWVPQLGGQIYSMPGMATHLNLMANELGSYNGSSANISGTGFAGMKFTVKAVSQNDFTHWAQQVRLVPKPLNLATYTALARPSQDNPVAYYASPANNLFDTIIAKYMMPANQSPDSQSTSQSISTRGMSVNMEMR